MRGQAYPLRVIRQELNDLDLDQIPMDDRHMNTLTPQERAQWVTEAHDALRCHMALRHCNAEVAYAELAETRIWSSGRAQQVLDEAFTAMNADSVQRL